MIKIINDVRIIINDDVYNKHAKEIDSSLLELCKKLGSIINSIVFSDVHAGGIQMGGCLRAEGCSEYIYDDVTIRYDWSNFKECIKLFEKKFTNIPKQNVDYFNDFVKAGEEYGWD